MNDDPPDDSGDTVDTIDNGDFHGEVTVYIRNGSCVQVNVGDKQIRARVFDYDVEFPCVANNLLIDESGQYFMELIV